MIIYPKTLGFICTTAHPEGCKRNVEEEIEYIQSSGSFLGPKNVLIIGASTGYGLASRIALAFGCSANTIGVIFEKQADETHTASAGWYNTAAFEEQANKNGIYAKTINGDAFSNGIKQQTIDLIKKDLKSIDLVIYSLASPRRIHPITGEVLRSVLKPIHADYRGKSLDLAKNQINEVFLPAATEEEIQHTIGVMGGEDWEMWMDLLLQHHLLAPGAITIAYSYLGSEVSYPIYSGGTIGKAKEHLQQSSVALNRKLAPIAGKAYVSVNKAVVTQASSAIPIIPLYMSMLLKVMSEQGTDESCIQQMRRLFQDNVYSGKPLVLDAEGRIRLDDLELDPSVQQVITKAWVLVNDENLNEFADVQKYHHEFLRLFGFGHKTINYEVDVNHMVPIPSLSANTQVRIELVRDKDKLKEIYKLRYYIYAHVIGVPPVGMDDEKQEFHEKIDDSAYVFGAYVGDKLVGTARGFMYKGMHPDDLELVTLYNVLSYKDATMDNSAEVNRFSVLDEYQKYGVSSLLIKEISIAMTYKLNPDLKYVFIEAVDSFVKYYQFFHFKVIKPPIYNPHYKRQLYLMCLNVDDLIDKQASTPDNIVLKL